MTAASLPRPREDGATLYRIALATALAVRKLGGTAEVCIVTVPEYLAIAAYAGGAYCGDALIVFAPDGSKLKIAPRMDARPGRLLVGSEADLG